MKINRHLTAIHRRALSTPFKALFKLKLLVSGDRMTVLDYGCGHGDDVKRLRARGITAHGYDPAFFPSRPRPADIVNLGFVLNTIESRRERERVLLAAWKLARKLMVVSVLRDGATGERYRDGVVTSRGTFQKNYSAAELGDFLDGTLPSNAYVERAGDLLFLVYRV
jgi:DNA phosphorothioation-associated putative methyltransferase